MSQPLDLAESLARLSRSSATGRVVVTSRAGTRTLLLVGGEIRGVRSTLEDERLGSWLVAHGVVSDDEFATALLSQLEDPSRPIGRILVDRGWVPATMLDQMLTRLALTIVERAARDDEASTTFEDDAVAQGTVALPGFATRQLILTAARSSRRQTSKHRALAELGATVELALEPDEIWRQLDLEPREADLVDRLSEGDDPLPLDALVTGDPGSLDALARLVVAGVVRAGSERVVPGVPVEVEPESWIESDLEQVTEPGTMQPPGIMDPVAARLERARQLEKLGDIPGAVVQLEQACEIDTDPGLLVRLAQLLQNNRMHPQRVLSLLRKALENDPGLTDGWNSLARYWLAADSPDRARRARDRVRQLDPKHPSLPDLDRLLE